MNPIPVIDMQGRADPVVPNPPQRRGDLDRPDNRVPMDLMQRVVALLDTGLSP